MFSFNSPLFSFNSQFPSVHSVFNSFLQNPFLIRPEQEVPVDRQRQTFRNTKLKKNNSKVNVPKVQYKPHQSMYWKQLGNDNYYGCNFQKALECYSKAIQIDNTNSIFFSNRAKVYKVLGKLTQAYKDAQEAIQLDQSNYRGHLICGLVQAQLSKQDEDCSRIQNSLIRLRKALALYTALKRESKNDQISIYIYRAKKLRWYKQLQHLKKIRSQLGQKFRQYIQQDQTLTPQQKQEGLKQFLQNSQNNLNFQIPDYLIDKISLELMEDPVCLQSGHTYERQTILQHLQKNGLVDPITRQPVSGKVYPNLSVKRAVEQFLEQNPWAFEYRQGQDWRQIDF